MKQTIYYTNYEIHGCKSHYQIVEQCEDHEAEFYTLYGRLSSGGLESIGDFTSREAAESVENRIIGNPKPQVSYIKVYHNHEQEGKVLRTSASHHDIECAAEDATGFDMHFWDALEEVLENNGYLVEIPVWDELHL